MAETTHLPLPQAKRAALLLAAAAAIGGAVGPITIGMGGLVGLSLLPPDQAGLATLPVTTFVVGSTIASIPAALSMQRFGRRAGFVAGALIGAAGAAFAAWAIVAGSFWLLVAAMTVLGASGAFGQQYRFAAADAAEPGFKARAISWVMAGGVVTGVLGPQVAINTQWIIPSVAFAGPFVVLVGLFLVTAAILWLLAVPAPARITATTDRGRLLRTILAQPKFLIALLSAVASFSLMSAVMTATPLAMVGHHHTTADSQIAIQWHVIAMFAPSFFTGALIDRFGKSGIAIAGFVLIGGAASVALTGTGLMQFWISLILLGLGWNFAFIAATAMLAGLYRPEEAFRVQAVNEFILFGTVALASFSSGGLLATAGWATINLLVYPVVAICVGLIVWQALHEKRAIAG